MTPPNIIDNHFKRDFFELLKSDSKIETSQFFLVVSLIFQISKVKFFTFLFILLCLHKTSYSALELFLENF